MKKPYRSLALAAVCLTGHAAAQDNLVVNGGFDTDATGWEAGPAPYQWTSEDREGSPGSGSVEISNGVRRIDQGLSQCFPTEGGTRIELGAWSLLPVDASEEARAIVTAVQYESDDCTDGALLYFYSNRTQAAGEWTLQNIELTTVYGTRSVRLWMTPAPRVDDLTVIARYDDAYYRETEYGRFVINPSLSSSWYDPEQSGHGIMFHLLDRHQAWMCWYTFDGAGDPAWLCGLGRVTQVTNSARFDEVFFMEGGRFPPDFDPDRVDLVPWGSIEIEFFSCGEGLMRWTTDASGYSSGEMSLRRLTPLWDNPCVD